jgi:hypothetical protein
LASNPYPKKIKPKKGNYSLKAEIINKIKKGSIRKKLPDIYFTSISFEHFENLAKFFEFRGQHHANTAIEENIVPERYARNMKMFSPKEQTTLLRLRVNILGLGGMGGLP